VNLPAWHYPIGPAAPVQVSESGGVLFDECSMHSAVTD